jgi:universal stress protein E
VKTGTVRSVMVAVRSLDRSSRDLLRKAAQLAKAYDASVHLVHVIALPYGTATMPQRADLRRAAEDGVRERRAELLKLAKRPELRGVTTRATVAWDYPAAEGLIRAVLKHRPQILIAESHRHGRFARLFLTNTDWDLIRNCPCPLWLSKSARLSTRGAVIAALDPFHSHAKPAALDQVILRHAVEAAGGDKSRVLACHVYPLPQPVVSVEAYWPTLSDEEQRAYRSRAQYSINTTVKGHEIPTDSVIVVGGDPVAQLPRLARKHGANVLVMGAVSRRGLRRIFIGNTAERLIDEAPCDVLIVKPRGFRTPVSRRPAAPAGLSAVR